jgi:hypothetical protein
MYHKYIITELLLSLGILSCPLAGGLFLSLDTFMAAGGELPGTVSGSSQDETPARIPGTMETPAYPDAPEPPFLSPENLTLSFRVPEETKTPAVAPWPVQEEVTSGPVEIPGPVEKDNLKYLGSIKVSDEREWIYLKDTDTGQIIAAKNIVLVSTDETFYMVNIEGNKFIIRRD